MAKAQRDKGNRGEREVARLIADELGYEVKRRCRQHEGDSDLVGVPGWSLEVKNHARATRAQIAAWWQQACAQATTDNPALVYKRAPGWWRVMWIGPYGYPLEGDIEAWAAVVRESLPVDPLGLCRMPTNP